MQTDCVVLKLDRSSFKRLLGPLEQLLEKNSELYHKYYDGNENKENDNSKREGNENINNNQNQSLIKNLKYLLLTIATKFFRIILNLN